MRTRNDDINQAVNIKLTSLNSQPTRELGLSERPLAWLVERHTELLSQAEHFLLLAEAVFGKGRSRLPLELKVEIEGIEDELIDRDTMGELNRTKRLDKDLWDRAQTIIQRGSNR